MERQASISSSRPPTSLARQTSGGHFNALLRTELASQTLWEGTLTQTTGDTPPTQTKNMVSYQTQELEKLEEI